MNAYYQPPRFSISRLALAAMKSAVSTAGAVVLPAERADDGILLLLSFNYLGVFRGQLVYSSQIYLQFNFAVI